MTGEPVQFSVFLEDEAATLAFGARLGRTLAPGLYIALSGDLGAGKTTLARGVLRGLGYGGKVKSPTYALVEVYKLSRLDFYHFDLYRFKDPQEWRDAGFQEHFGAGSICLVEWPERAADLLPAPDMRIALRAERGGRRLEIEANSENGRHCLKLLQS
ncbi:MAG TPA: tRNA (adenosine(37)-N6)-threonylcarbamoyltransferase complex ATPase subunit type 1 TsaE [Burkholderiales bacterium]|jgi:tRNA threonylcarbamoyladenosine biosynthesis protein TsaE|nr:tRNA (adenosine(37)-N6)-threonylcarbamoyltransferase complex ATPase subunit type 1 TsaE [Burkholderiales bacterium]